MLGRLKKAYYEKKWLPFNTYGGIIKQKFGNFGKRRYICTIK
jgi:hypothetical protein